MRESARTWLFESAAHHPGPDAIDRPIQTGLPGLGCCVGGFGGLGWFKRERDVVRGGLWVSE